MKRPEQGVEAFVSLEACPHASRKDQLSNHVVHELGGLVHRELQQFLVADQFVSAEVAMRPSIGEGKDLRRVDQPGVHRPGPGGRQQPPTVGREQRHVETLQAAQGGDDFTVEPPDPDGVVLGGGQDVLPGG